MTRPEDTRRLSVVNLEALHRARLALQEAEDGLRRALGERQAAERFLDSIPSGSERL